MGNLPAVLAATGGNPLFTSSPDFGGGPGSSAIQTLIDYTAAVALGLSLLALLVSAALMGFGHFTNHYGSSDAGKRGLLVSLSAAFLVGIAASLNHFFFHLGQVG